MKTTRRTTATTLAAALAQIEHLWNQKHITQKQYVKALKRARKWRT